MGRYGATTDTSKLLTTSTTLEHRVIEVTTKHKVFHQNVEDENYRISKDPTSWVTKMCIRDRIDLSNCGWSLKKKRLVSVSWF